LDPDEGVYSCNFGFYQQINDSDYLPGSDTPFDDSGSIIEVASSASCSGDPCFVVAGSNSVLPVEVDVDKISPSEAQVPQYKGGGTGIGYEDGKSFMLEEIADRTKHPDYNKVFQQFPTGGFGSDSERRNPLVVCQREGPCPDPTTK
jgi:hypothetical protein